MKILNCTGGVEKPVELGKKKAEILHLWCYKCKDYGDHLPSECSKENQTYKLNNKIINAEVLQELPSYFVTYYCDCSKKIDDERIRALQMLGKNEDEYKCVECAMKSDYKVKGFYQGISGDNLKIAKKLGREEHLVDRNEEIYNTFINGGFSDI